MKIQKKILIPILFLSCFCCYGSSTVSLKSLLECFNNDQITQIEHANQLNFSYKGFSPDDENHKTLSFWFNNDYNNDRLNLTYNNSSKKCVYLLYIFTDKTTFSKIKTEILANKPQLIKSYNEQEDNGIVSIYQGANYLYKLTVNYSEGIMLYSIVIQPKLISGRLE